MLRSSTAALMAATVFALVPITAQAQEQGQAARVAARCRQGAGRRRLHRVPPDQHDHRQLGLHARRLERADRHDDRPVAHARSSRPRSREYLAAHFPPNTRRAPKLVPGRAEITFKEWQMPTLGQRSRDPVQAADGSIWWAGQFGNLIGRLNPATGEMKEYPLPPNAMPHTVELDAKGMPWYTGNKNGSIGKLDPATGQITVYKMPDPAAKDPHTGSSTRRASCCSPCRTATWSAASTRRPATSSSSRCRSRTRSRTASRSTPTACPGRVQRRPCLVKIDPATMELNEIKLPLAGTTVRRLDIAEDGMIWYVNSGQGRIGRLDPKTGEIKEWASPSGPKSHPYAIVGGGRHRLVQRVGHAAGCAGPLRPRDRDVPELGDPVGRHLCRHHPAHAARPGKATC